MPEEWVQPGVYDEESSPGHTLEGVPTSVAAFVGTAVDGPLGSPVRMSGFVGFEETFGGLWSQSLLGNAVRDFFANGGTNAVVLRVAPRTPGGPLRAADLGSDEGGGLHALDEVPFNLLVIPPHVQTRSLDPGAVAVAAAFCEERRAMLLLDAPRAWSTVEEAVAAVQGGLGRALGTTSANAAVYFPWLRQPDPLRDDAVGAFPAAGAVAGVIARTDAEHGAWKAPAGPDAALAGAVELTVSLESQDAAVLNASAINCLRSFPGAGPVVWGSRTLQGDDRIASEWKYLPVRRTALFLEESLSRGLGWVCFEPNDETLWARIRLEVGDFLERLFRRGAFQGRTPAEAWFAKCDAETTTQADLDQGVVNLLVGFAPLRPAEFVVLRLRLRTLEPE